MTAPTATTDERYGEQGATSSWADAERVLQEAPLYWLATVVGGGSPHVVPLVGVWHDGAFHFVTGGEERKTRHLRADAHCTVLTGRNDLHGGTDVTLEGSVEPVTDAAGLQAVADAYGAKYGDEWAFEVVGSGLQSPGGTGDPGTLYRVRPVTARAFAKEPYSQTTYAF